MLPQWVSVQTLTGREREKAGTVRWSLSSDGTVSTSLRSSSSAGIITLSGYGRIHEVDTDELEAVDTIDKLLDKGDSGETSVGVGRVGKEGDETVGVADRSVGVGESDGGEGGGSCDSEDTLSCSVEGPDTDIDGADTDCGGDGADTDTDDDGADACTDTETCGTADGGRGEIARGAGVISTVGAGAVVDDTVDTLSLSVAGGMGEAVEEGIEMLPGAGASVEMYDVGDALGRS